MGMGATKRASGFFIAIEGIDAVGKKTQTSLLQSWLTSKGYATRTFSFPAYETIIGKEIKKFLAGTVDYPPQVRAMLYAANRWEKKTELEDILARSEVMLVNRYSGSNLAYGASMGLEIDWILGIESGLPAPDLVLVLDAPPAELVARRGETKDSYERNLALQSKARQIYLQLARRFGWSVVDANRDIDETSREVISVAGRALKRRTV
jgi:dTMP kinase